MVPDTMHAQRGAKEIWIAPVPVIPLHLLQKVIRLVRPKAGLLLFPAACFGLAFFGSFASCGMPPREDRFAIICTHLDFLLFRCYSDSKVTILHFEVPMFHLEKRCLLARITCHAKSLTPYLYHYLPKYWQRLPSYQIAKCHEQARCYFSHHRTLDMVFDFLFLLHIS